MFSFGKSVSDSSHCPIDTACVIEAVVGVVNRCVDDILFTIKIKGFV